MTPLMACAKLEHVLFLLRSVFWTLCCLRCVRKAGNWALGVACSSANGEVYVAVAEF